MRCPVCGESCSENTRVCPACGTVITKEAVRKADTAWAEQAEDLVPIPRHSVGLSILWYFLTGGIFGLFWFYRLDREMNRVLRQNKRFGLITFILLITETVLFNGFMLWLYIPSTNRSTGIGLPMTLAIITICVMPLAVACLVIWVIKATKTAAKVSAKVGDRLLIRPELYVLACICGLPFLVYAKFQGILNNYAEKTQDALNPGADIQPQNPPMQKV